MCGRYYIDDDATKEIEKLIEGLDIKNTAENYKTGEIYPTDSALVLLKQEDRAVLKTHIWGFPGFRGSRVIINARSETASEKISFRESLLYRRCIIPAKGFFEWDRKKAKLYFTDESSPLLYMAGLYHVFGSECRFVILTTSANGSMADVHDRMPLLLSREQIPSWLSDNSAVKSILAQIPVPLCREAALK